MNQQLNLPFENIDYSQNNAVFSVTQRANINWEEKLIDGEFGSDSSSGKKFVFLAGLQRLAHEAGLIHSQLTHTFIPFGSQGIFQCVYTVKFMDGSVWAGSADCNRGNTDEKFFKYPTAVAESRAEARALKKALNIRCLAFEEIGFDSEATSALLLPSSKISGSVVQAIKKIHERKCPDLDIKSILVKVLSADRVGQIGESIFDWSDLNIEEGQKVLEFLNKPITDLNSRESRKAELKKIAGEE